MFQKVSTSGSYSIFKLCKSCIIVLVKLFIMICVADGLRGIVVPRDSLPLFHFLGDLKPNGPDIRLILDRSTAEKENQMIITK